MMVMIFQIFLALGAFGGGIIVDHAGIVPTFYLGSVLLFLAAIVVAAFAARKAVWELAYRSPLAVRHGCLRSAKSPYFVRGSKNSRLDYIG